IFPVTNNFEYTVKGGPTYTISRKQLPLLPAYPFVDYKVQCRSMPLVMVDLSECGTLQSVYSMLLRAT
ncbi:hypothetical protein B0H13DRAFT_1552121, partial [Mycena leptocephala]